MLRKIHKHFFVAIICGRLLTMSMSLEAQFNIVIPPQSSTSYGINDLTRIAIVNTSASVQNSCCVIVDCNDAGGGKLFSLKCPIFDLQPGSKYIEYTWVTNAQVLSSSPEYYSFIQTGKLPAGNYSLCANLISVATGSSLADECVPLKISSQSEIVLVSPYDQQVLNTFYPNFFWSFTGLPADNTVVYSIKICELVPGQSYEEAITYNVPLVFDQNLPLSSFTYPSSAPQLLASGKYVWEIEAIVNGRNKFLSPIWMFQYRRNKPVKKPEPITLKPAQYPYLEKSPSNAVYLFEDSLSFRYKNECNDTVLRFAVRRVGKDQPLHITDHPINITFGINYLSFPITKEMKKSAKKGDRYVLAVVNCRKEDWRMKFIVSDKKKNK